MFHSKVQARFLSDGTCTVNPVEEGGVTKIYKIFAPKMLLPTRVTCSIFVLFLLFVESKGEDPASLLEVNSITPATGSVLGGQRLHIDGSGFNIEFFEGSNSVTLISGGVKRSCIVVEGACTVDCGSSKRIVCEIM